MNSKHSKEAAPWSCTSPTAGRSRSTRRSRGRSSSRSCPASCTKATPSIRLLAKELRISVITTKRAYEDLEAAGFIVTQPGRGSFVAAQNPALVREEYLKKIEGCLQGAVDAARTGGIGYEEVSETLRLLWEG